MSLFGPPAPKEWAFVKNSMGVQSAHPLFATLATAAQFGGTMGTMNVIRYFHALGILLSEDGRLFSYTIGDKIGQRTSTPRMDAGKIVKKDGKPGIIQPDGDLRYIFALNPLAIQPTGEHMVDMMQRCYEAGVFPSEENAARFPVPTGRAAGQRRAAYVRSLRRELVDEFAVNRILRRALNDDEQKILELEGGASKAPIPPAPRPKPSAPHPPAPPPPAPPPPAPPPPAPPPSAAPLAHNPSAAPPPAAPPAAPSAGKRYAMYDKQDAVEIDRGSTHIATVMPYGGLIYVGSDDLGTDIGSELLKLAEDSKSHATTPVTKSASGMPSGFDTTWLTMRAAEWSITRQRETWNEDAAFSYISDNFTRVTIVGDGNCMYRAIALWKYGKEDAHPKVRDELCTFLEDVVTKKSEKYPQFNRNIQEIGSPLMEDFIGHSDSGTFDFTQCRTNGTWGNDAMTGTLASMLYNVCIITVVAAQGHTPQFMNVNVGTEALEDDHVFDNVFWIYNRDNYHYDAIVPQRKLEDAPATFKGKVTYPTPAAPVVGVRRVHEKPVGFNATWVKMRGDAIEKHISDFESKDDKLYDYACHNFAIFDDGIEGFNSLYKSLAMWRYGDERKYENVRKDVDLFIKQILDGEHKDKYEYMENVIREEIANNNDGIHQVVYFTGTGYKFDTSRKPVKWDNSETALMIAKAAYEASFVIMTGVSKIEASENMGGGKNVYWLYKKTNGFYMPMIPLIGNSIPKTPQSCNAKFGTRSDFKSSEFPTVYAIGDVHGDIEALRACLRMTGCVDGDAWNGQKGVAIVVLGDVVDRWRRDGVVRDILMVEKEDGLQKSLGEIKGEEAQMLDLLNKLALKAEKCNSAVFRLVGNHEIMQRDTGEGTYTYQSQYSSPFARGGTGPEGMHTRYVSFLAGVMKDKIADCHVKAIVKIGTHVFVHGGVSEGLVAKAGSRNLLELCNSLLANDLKRTKGEPSPEFREFLHNGSDSILWDRKFGQSQDEDRCSADVGNMFKALTENVNSTVSSIVVAHCQQTDEGNVGKVPGNSIEKDGYARQTTIDTPANRRFEKPEGVKYHNINTVCDGKIWRLDVGMSRAFRRKPTGDDEDYRALLKATRPAILKIMQADGKETDYEIIHYNEDLPGGGSTSSPASVPTQPNNTPAPVSKPR